MMTVKYAGDPDIQVNLDIIVSEHLNLLLFGTKTTGVKACPHPNIFSGRPQPWFAPSSSSKYCMLQRLLCVTNHFSPDSIFQWIHQLCCYSNQLVIVTLNKKKKHIRPFLYELLQSWTSLCPLCYLLRLPKGRSSVDNRDLKAKQPRTVMATSAKQ